MLLLINLLILTEKCIPGNTFPLVFTCILGLIILKTNVLTTFAGLLQVVENVTNMASKTGRIGDFKDILTSVGKSRSKQFKIFIFTKMRGESFRNMKLKKPKTYFIACSFTAKD